MVVQAGGKDGQKGLQRVGHVVVGTKAGTTRSGTSGYITKTVARMTGTSGSTMAGTIGKTKAKTSATR